ncbi:Cytochrome P450 107B1 [Streptomyces sp. YIM 121038]|uniref:cytochrome P450 family protein n=1 Tax=Streptomyces sp. YIM 121038 TaxID=2136401 RepID=UPI0011103C09|nr:cytochrome P450 [Streptomyces sp. YIM 121038]QCX79963.1 Cytochrome P450 107B1 [Streptomyces sp. YIM 121038]
MADAVIDLASYEDFTTNPHRAYAELRARGPVHRVRFPPPDHDTDHYLVVGYEEARAALADPRLTKSSTGIDLALPDEVLIGPHLLTVDPPHHTRLRSLIGREFTARRVQALRPRIQEITDGLLDGMLAKGSRADLVEALAFPLPMTVICELLGVPDLDRERFRQLSNEATSPTTEEWEETVFVALAAYLDELIETKRAVPGDDLLSALIRTRAEDGDRLSHEELRGMAYLLLIAGHETTVHLITNTVHALLARPAQLAELRADPGLLDGAIEEGLRHEGPVENSTYRFTTEPTEMAGTLIPAGSVVVVGLTAADHDPGKYGAPDDFDLHRAPQGHVAFGHGIHFCLGAPLARVEGRIALASLLERCPDLALDGPATDWRPGLLMRGLRRLDVRW